VLPGNRLHVDGGMCGDYESVLGMDKEEPLNRFLTKIPRGRFEPAMVPATLSGLASMWMTKPGCPAHDSIAARWCFDTYRAAVLGRVRKREFFLQKTANPSSWRAGTRGSQDRRPWQQGGDPDGLHP
jgi:hypothetical protein